MSLKNRAAKKYCRSVRNLLPYPAKKRRFVLREIEANISACLEDNPSATLQDLEMRFGAPSQIAASYVDEMGTEALLKQLKVRRRIFALISTGVMLALLIWASMVTAVYIEFQKVDNGYFEETIW